MMNGNTVLARVRGARIRSGALGCVVLAGCMAGVGTINSAGADQLDLIVATVDSGARLSPLIAGRVRCTESSTMTGSGRITVAGRTVARVQFTGGQCTPAWNAIGFRLSARSRTAVRRAASRARRTPVLVATVTARSTAGTRQSTGIRATLRP